MKPRHQAFVDAFLSAAKGNGTEAAKLAGYSTHTAGQIASQLLKRPDIKAAVERRLQRATMRTDESLECVAKIAKATPEKITAADVIAANTLILKVNGALKDKSSNDRITVNIGFLAAPQPTHAIDGEVMSEGAHVALIQSTS